MKTPARINRIAKKEALLGIAIAIVHFLWWYGFAYGLGGQPIADYQFIWGMPAWFFYSCIVGFFMVIILVSVVVRCCFQHIDLHPSETQDDTTVRE